MGHPETDIVVDEVGLRRAAERALEELQILLELEIAQRDLVIAAGKQTEARLRASELALRQLFDQKLDSVMILNLETGRYIDINDEYSRNSGYSREEVVGKRSREHKSFEYPEHEARLVAELKRVGLVRNMEAAFRRKDGSTDAGLISAFEAPLICLNMANHPVGVAAAFWHEMGHHLTHDLFGPERTKIALSFTTNYQAHLDQPEEIAADLVMVMGCYPRRAAEGLFKATAGPSGPLSSCQPESASMFALSLASISRVPSRRAKIYIPWQG